MRRMSNSGPREPLTIRSVSESAAHSLAKPHDLRHQDHDGRLGSAGAFRNLLAPVDLRNHLVARAGEAVFRRRCAANDAVVLPGQRSPAACGTRRAKDLDGPSVANSALSCVSIDLPVRASDAISAITGIRHDVSSQSARAGWSSEALPWIRAEGGPEPL
jgi:hypothetical protein